MRTVRTLTAAALAGGALLGLAATATADTPSPSPSASAAGGPTEAGTSFRTATAVKVGQEATADASTGDYLYWVLPLDAGQRATVKATVTLPAAASRHGAANWRLDVYDGLRRRQPCMYGKQAAPAAKEAGAVELSCTLRPVRTGADTWANDPLPGSYYVRLTVVDLAPEDLGQPVRAQVRADATDTGGAYAVDGALSAPWYPASRRRGPRKPTGSSRRPASSRKAAGPAAGGPTAGSGPWPADCSPPSRASGGTP